MTEKMKTIIAIHGAGMQANAWDLLLADLLLPDLTGAGLACRALSLPGHGDRKGDLLPSVEAMADWLRGEIGENPPQSTFLLGHSMGALVALEAARSQAVCGLILAGAAAAMPVHPDLLRQAGETPQDAAALILKWGVPRHHPDAAAFLKERMCPSALANDLAACDAYAGGENAATGCGKPALVISGSDDKLAKAASGQALAEMMPQGRFCLIDGCGHMPMAETPAEMTRQIKAFVSSCRT